MAPLGGILALSGFRAVISAGCNIILGVAIDLSALLLLRRKALSFKVNFFTFFTLSDSASAPSRQSFARICPVYSRLGPMSSAAEGQWYHLRLQFKLHHPLRVVVPISCQAIQRAEGREAADQGEHTLHPDMFPVRCPT